MTATTRWSANAAIATNIGGTVTSIINNGTTLLLGNGSPNAGSVAAIKATSGKFIWGLDINMSGAQFAGLWTTSRVLPTAGSDNCIDVNNSSGAKAFLIQSGSVVSTFSISGTTGNNPYYLLDVGAGSAWVTLDGVSFYGAGGTVYNATQVAAGTGGINWGSFPEVSTGQIVLAGTNGGGTLSILNSGFPGTVPTGFGPLPTTTDILSIGLFNTGGTVPIHWEGGASGLNGSLDGGTFSTLTGTTTGSSGLAIGPTVSDFNIHGIQIQDVTYPIDVTYPTYFQACPSGPPLLSMIDQQNTTTETWSLSSSANTLSFALNSNVINHDGTFGEADTFVFANSSGGTLLPVSIVYSAGGGGVNGTLTVGSNSPIVLTSGADGQVSGNMTLGVSSGNVVGTLAFTANGTLHTSSSYTFATGTTNGLVSEILVTSQSTLNGRTMRGASVSGTSPATTSSNQVSILCIGT